ncbi:head maturation protease, ClpP-related [Stenotrophomonas maltophilia]|uniref:head maturation protease, ClpP-related n=1 Tax=Stenotrophomonas maltophilia TaxID=40324 RepID=UPI000DA84F6E|nr:head maturation protease, ClpP-related [Stenotrophomonas maltophilia]PZS71836.1 peptidase S14 [Stenotrophomonas maltophilia]HEL3791242.1 Clp protease ClpP [Stenotrophomonas maltophilia]
MPIPKLLQLAKNNASQSKPLRAETEGREATIYLHGVIGGWWGDIDETMFAQAMAGIDADVIHLRIDSPGGDVFAARSMMTAIAQHKATVIAHIDGLAASAATGICMACDEVEISQGAGFMIHNAWTVAVGNKADMTKTGELLAKIDTGLAGDYTRRTGKEQAQIVQWMDEETWFTADETKEHGFADRVVEVVGKKKASNTWNLNAYENAPAALSVPAEDPDENSAIVAHLANLERHLALLERPPAPAAPARS